MQSSCDSNCPKSPLPPGGGRPGWGLNQTEADLNWYDYGARFYDPELGRWHSVDRFAEKYADMSPYQYGADNPIKFVDINGDSAWAITNQWNKDFTQKYNNVPQS